MVAERVADVEIEIGLLQFLPQECSGDANAAGGALCVAVEQERGGFADGSHGGGAQSEDHRRLSGQWSPLDRFGAGRSRIDVHHRLPARTPPARG